MKRARGFSLVELLVLIVILAVLAALLFPVFSHSKARGKVAGCLSNLHQLDLAQRMYAGDHDSYACPHQPGGRNLGDHFWNAVRWKAWMAPYIKNDSVGICPADDAPGKPYMDGGVNYDDKAISTYLAPYGHPWDLHGYDLPSLNIDTIRDPANQIHLQDLQMPYRDDPGKPIVTRTFHRETMSFLYWDGHAIHKPDPWLRM
ncbi:type II secretion system protein [bacterium]|nr:MAG: type II secretion system protein [bacterium]